MIASCHVKSAYFTPLPIHIGTNSGRSTFPSPVCRRNRKLYFDGMRFSACSVNVCELLSNAEPTSNGLLSSRISLLSSASWPAPVYLTTTVYDASLVSVHSWKSPTGVNVLHVVGTGHDSTSGSHGL